MLRNDQFGGWHPDAGRLVLLPPPTEPMDAAIGKILSVYGKASPCAELPPAWAGQVAFPPLAKCEAQMGRLEEDKTKIQREIDKLAAASDRIRSHFRLLYSRGRELEDAVVEAFRALGFDDIEPMGGADEADAALGMGRGTPYPRGVIEAKGADGGAQMRHILQCKRWANQRAAAGGGATKGIFVPNQHRLRPYPGSLEARMKIEPNQLEQAELDDVCIIPSCVLFEAVRRVLGGEEPDREEIAARIAATKGVLKDVL